MRTILTIISLLLSSVYFSQVTVDRETISSGGESKTTVSGSNYMYNIGGLVVNTASTSSYIITQDFEQPLETILTISVFDPPNAFSPDGDGINDTWLIALPDVLLEDNTVIIYNRWGDEVTKIENYNNFDQAWDGSFQVSGKQVPTGTYFYIVQSKIADKKFSGWVQVVR